MRSALYMAAIVTMRHNPIIRACCGRLVAGKPRKVAIVACMCKHLIIVSAMIREHLPWRPSEDQTGWGDRAEALMVMEGL